MYSLSITKKRHQSLSSVLVGPGAAALTAWLPVAEQAPGCFQPSVTGNKDSYHIKTLERARGAVELAAMQTWARLRNMQCCLTKDLAGKFSRTITHIQRLSRCSSQWMDAWSG